MELIFTHLANQIQPHLFVNNTADCTSRHYSSISNYVATPTPRCFRTELGLLLEIRSLTALYIYTQHTFDIHIITNSN